MVRDQLRPISQHRTTMPSPELRCSLENTNLEPPKFHLRDKTLVLNDQTLARIIALHLVVQNKMPRP